MGELFKSIKYRDRVFLLFEFKLFSINEIGLYFEFILSFLHSGNSA